MRARQVLNAGSVQFRLAIVTAVVCLVTSGCARTDGAVIHPDMTVTNVPDPVAPTEPVVETKTDAGDEPVNKAKGQLVDADPSNDDWLFSAESDQSAGEGRLVTSEGSNPPILPAIPNYHIPKNLAVAALEKKAAPKSLSCGSPAVRKINVHLVITNMTASIVSTLQKCGFDKTINRRTPTYKWQAATPLMTLTSHDPLRFIEATQKLNPALHTAVSVAAAFTGIGAVAASIVAPVLLPPGAILTAAEAEQMISSLIRRKIEIKLKNGGLGALQLNAPAAGNLISDFELNGYSDYFVLLAVEQLRDSSAALERLGRTK